MELNLDFLTEQEIADLLDELSIAAHAAGEDSVLLEMGNDFASAKVVLYTFAIKKFEFKAKIVGWMDVI